MHVRRGDSTLSSKSSQSFGLNRSLTNRQRISRQERKKVKWRFFCSSNNNRYKTFELGLPVTNAITKFCLITEMNKIITSRKVGGSPGLVVMGGDSHSKGRGFESLWRILDGHDIFSH